MMEFFSDDSVVFLGRTSFRGKDSIKQFFDEVCRRLAERKHTLNDFKVKTSGDETKVSCNLSFSTRVVKTGETCKVESRDDLTLVSEGGRWAVKELAISSLIPKTIVKHGLKNLGKLIRARGEFRFS